MLGKWLKIQALLTLLLFATGQTAVGQYLNKVIETPDRGEVTFAFDWSTSQLISVGHTSHANFNNLARSHFKRYDANFEIDLETFHGDSAYTYLSGWNMAYLVNNYYIAGYKYDPNNPSNIISTFIKYDTLGNVIWEKNLMDTLNSVRTLSCIPTTDSNLVILGFTVTVGPPYGEPFVLKADTSGEVLWYKFLGTPQNEGVSKIEQTADDGFIVSTVRYISGDNWITVVYKLDAAGNIQWTKNLGGGGYMWRLSCSQLPDGGYFCSGGVQIGPSSWDSWFVKLDAAGNVLNDTVISFSPYRDGAGLCNPQIVNNSIRVTGQSLALDLNTKEVFYASFDMDGNFEWVRFFSQRTNENLLTSLISLPNNFMLLAGFVFPNNNPPDGTTADEWIVIVDEHGCEVADCALSVLNPKGENPRWEVFPNPTDGIITFKIAPEHLSNASILITDLTGKVVRVVDITHSTPTADLTGLPQGTYLCALVNQNSTLSVKKVIYVR